MVAALKARLMEVGGKRGSCVQYCLRLESPCDFVSQSVKVGFTVFDGIGMCTDGSVRGFQVENRLSRFHGHRHQTAIMLQQAQAIRVLLG